jgi:ATP-binding cassette, subfamily G (WHITE), member 2, PDR
MNSSYQHLWRKFGLLVVYIIFNISAAIFLYWWTRTPKAKSVKKKVAVGGPVKI